MTSLFTHSTVSPTRIGPGGAANAIGPMGIRTVAGATAEADPAGTVAKANAIGTNRIHFGFRRARMTLLDRRRRVFSVLLMALKQLEAGLQQTLELAIPGRRNQRRRE